MKSSYTYAYSGFQLNLPLEAIYDMSGQGDQTESVSYWKKYISNDLDPDLIRRELKEYGAWEAIDLRSSEKNWERLLWITACNLKESEEFQDDTDADEND